MSEFETRMTGDILYVTLSPLSDYTKEFIRPVRVTPRSPL
jgi:hypothetical protein